MAEENTPGETYYCYSCHRFTFVRTSTGLICSRCGDSFLEEVVSFVSSFSELEDSNASLVPPEHLEISDNESPEDSEESDYEIDENDLDSLDPATIILPGVMDDVMDDFHILHYEAQREVEQLSELFSQIIESSTGPSPLSEDKIKSIPSVVITEDHLSKEGACTICLDSFSKSEEAKILPCDHMYHESCITQWLERKNICPNCRQVVHVPDDGAESQSSSSSPSSDFFWRNLRIPGSIMSRLFLN